MNPANRPGFLMVFEGTDGTGKSTQVELAFQYLKLQGYSTVITREPTDGKYGQRIRNLYRNRNQYSPEQELELFLNDRREHVDHFIKPALAAGKIILCDRYFLSTAAYQGAIGFDPEEIIRRNAFAPDPDIVFLLQVAPQEALARIVNIRGDSPDDFEGLQSLQRVDEIFSSIERSYMCPVDASGSPNEVHQQILLKLAPLLRQLPRAGLEP